MNRWLIGKEMEDVDVGDGIRVRTAHRNTEYHNTEYSYNTVFLTRQLESIAVSTTLFHVSST